MNCECMVMEPDRLNFIVKEVDEWKKIDPSLQNKNGFLLNFFYSDYLNYSIIQNSLWKKLLKEANGKGISIVELVFNKMKEMNYLVTQGYSGMYDDSIYVNYLCNLRESIHNLRNDYEGRSEEIQSQCNL
jgi:hypothetical protein